MKNYKWKKITKLKDIAAINKIQFIKSQNKKQRKFFYKKKKKYENYFLLIFTKNHYINRENNRLLNKKPRLYYPNKLNLEY